MNLFTIGFTKKNARKFFGLLVDAGATHVVDVRLNNVSQLAGFAKRDDLEYILERHGLGYTHLPELAPTKELLSGYRKGNITWAQYERKFLKLMKERQIETAIPKEAVAGGSLLCSEDEPDQCHRRLVAEYLSEHWGGLVVRHLR